VYRGGSGGAGEFGHIILQPGGPICSCGKKGCLESLASGTALARQARELVSAGVATRIGTLVGGDVSRISARVIHDAADEGDAVAIDLYRKAGMYLGVGIVNLMYLFNPGVFVIGGGVAKGWNLLYPSMQATVQQRIKEVYWRHCPIVPAVLGDDVSLIGAATLAHDLIQ
jgi:glucokinase